MKKRRIQGFTLAELLIVVAIIAVLVAIAIPIFNKQIEKSREAHDVDTMRQAASLAASYCYDGIIDKASAEKAGLMWWPYDGHSPTNAAGVYDPATGTFKAMKSSQVSDSDAYGKGTSIETGSTYKYFDGEKDRDIYKSSEDYTKAVVMVAIYPEGKNKHIDVYWKNAGNGGNGKYVGGGDNSDPNYSIRIPFE